MGFELVRLWTELSGTPTDDCSKSTPGHFVPHLVGTGFITGGCRHKF